MNATVCFSHPSSVCSVQWRGRHFFVAQQLTQSLKNGSWIAFLASKEGWAFLLFFFLSHFILLECSSVFCILIQILFIHWRLQYFLLEKPSKYQPLNCFDTCWFSLIFLVFVDLNSHGSLWLSTSISHIFVILSQVVNTEFFCSCIYQSFTRVFSVLGTVLSTRYVKTNNFPPSTCLR